MALYPDDTSLHSSEDSYQELIRDYEIKNRMKFVAIMALCLLVGCSARPTVDELEAEAMETGDWAAVEKRARMDKKFGVIKTDSVCRGDYVELCQTKSELEVCDCVSPWDLRPK